MSRVVVIGGGASGVFFSIYFKKMNPNSEVIILEQNDRVLKKLLKTGNGRCNIMNHQIGSIYYNDFSLIDRLYQNYNMELKLQEIGILVRGDFEGRLYPYTESTKAVVNTFLYNLDKYKVDVRTNYRVDKVEQPKFRDRTGKIKKADKFIINDEIECDYVVFATGSIAQAKTNGYDLLKKLGHKITELKPGLVPLYTKERTDHLKGLRWKCTIIHKERIRFGEVQFKDKGISGIIIMDISNNIDDGEVIHIDMLPELCDYELRYLVKNNGYKVLEDAFPRLLYQEILRRAEYNEENIIDVIKDFTYTVTGRRGFDEGQICLGGVDLSCVSKTFESKKCKNLYITGEVLNVDGGTGGYNLYFAWLSAYEVANQITLKLRGGE